MLSGNFDSEVWTAKLALHTLDAEEQAMMDKSVAAVTELVAAMDKMEL